MKPSQPQQKNAKHHKKATSNWYARMHQLPEQGAKESNKSLPQSIPHRLSQQLNLSIFFRIWLTVALIMVIAGLLVFQQLFEYIEPTSKQVLEDTLVDTGKLLSANLSQPLQTGQIYQESYQSSLDQAFSENNKSLTAEHSQKFVNKQMLNEMSTWFYQKTHSSFRVYVTDDKGMVIYDSLPAVPLASNLMSNSNKLERNAEGEDYSQWNDVHLTLKGKYGARSSRSDKADGSTTVMYVAQPIVDDSGRLIGVVSVGKPVSTILPYIYVARQRMFTTSLIIMLISLALAGVVAWWLQQSIALVTAYTRSLASDTDKPSFYLGRELNELTNTIETMKHRLENRAYVTDYVHTLTHELKSPLTAIKASGELLAETDLDEEDRIILSQTINEQSQKLQALIDRLLLLAKVEQPTFQLNTQPLNIMQLLQSLLNNHQASIQKRGLKVEFFQQLLEESTGNTDGVGNGVADNVTDGVRESVAGGVDNFKLNAVDITTLITHCEQTLVIADEFWLSQAIDNILANAIHFAEQNIQIVLIPPTAKHSNNKLTLQIINDGEPIPEYALDKVFDRYFSLSHLVSHEKAKNSTNKGTGLGLTLSKQVIEHHGGEITIDNVQLADDKQPLAGVQVTINLKVT